jgi:peptide/nickel transport system substrate-binding protein
LIKKNKKCKIMKIKKDFIVLIIFSLLLTISLINIDRNIDSWSAKDKIHLSSKPMQEVHFKVGVSSGPYHLDPHYAWDSSSSDVIDQVCEGLFAYNLSDPDHPIIPNLALSGTWNPAGTEYTCVLRQGVTFHDGDPFNADAVIFTWARLNWALNVTGTNTANIAQFAELYAFPDGSPIMSSIIKNNDYNITFVLNDPYVPFEALLCFSGSYMLSPSSTPPMAYIDTSTGDLIGTGPFVYDNYTSNVEVNFHAFDNYWKGKANITAMRFQIISDPNARHAALLTGDVHFISATASPWYSAIKSSPDLIFLNTSTTSNTISYLGMNNQQINSTIREAISYAIDYDYILNVLKGKNAERSMSPIPNGIFYANDTFDVPTLNFTRARLVMQSMGFGTGFDIYNDVQWVSQESTAPFFTYNYTYNIGNTFREELFNLLEDNMAKIGIRIEDAGMTFTQFINRIYERFGLHRNMLQLHWIGWGMDYNDPSDFINPLFTNRTKASNGVQYNGYTAAIEANRDPLALNDNVQLLMEAALSEVDPVAREALYDRIQELLIEEDRPWAWGFVNYVYHAYDQHLTGFQQNGVRKNYFYPCVWNSMFPILPGLFSIFSDADDPDTDGNFNVTWSPSVYADNYSLYVSSSVITEINGGVTLLLNEVTDLSYEASGYLDGTYYFLVVAKNGNGNTTSSNLLVNIEIPGPPAPFTLSSDAGNPDPDGDFTLTWTPSNSADNYSLYIYSSLITEINGSLTLLLDEVTDLSYGASGYSDGTYYFAVVAKNAYGTTLSNNIEVIVELEWIPGFEMWTMFFAISSVGLIILLRKKKKIT